MCSESVLFVRTRIRPVSPPGFPGRGLCGISGAHRESGEAAARRCFYPRGITRESRKCTTRDQIKGEEFIKKMISGSIKEEGGVYAISDQNQGQFTNFFTPAEVFTTVMISEHIKEEAYPTAGQDTKEFKNTLCTAEDFTTVMIPKCIKEEAYPTADLDTNKFKNTPCTAGGVFTTEMISGSIKEEGGAYEISDQNQEKLKNFCTPVGNTLETKDMIGVNLDTLTIVGLHGMARSRKHLLWVS
ncbi:hypothetical protein NDU88_000522 [Pleurodeles waltl]|uniref:Uncharacterized protein n=1 Tax=Pleurodeles waltl TaxID=8319 RepID=A0AAV7NAQ6_PLEWA|nr:hypothetical protein NDU88_000522 [Pleurodeles waltl]